MGNKILSKREVERYEKKEATRNVGGNIGFCYYW